MLSPFYSPFEMESSWKEVLCEELQKPYILSLAAFVARERASGCPVYPPEELVFNAFRLTPYSKVKVIIVGQDPYHGTGQAHGLSFSVPKGVPLPPSLKNIFKELVDDVGIPAPKHGCLVSWANQGVLLLNALLTVRHKEPLSHQGQGWELFTDAVIRALAKRSDRLVFVLWGKSAQEKCRPLAFLNGGARHHILLAAHPSPLSATNGFFGCRHFSKINQFLKQEGREAIDWSLPD